MHLLYLHGFRSSPRSFKAQRLQAWLAAHRPDVHWWCPQLPPSPAAAWALITEGIKDWPQAQLVVVGSSLGGFYATAVAEATGCRALLLNPAVDPARDLAAYTGEQTQFHSPDETFFFRPEYIAELQALRAPALTRLSRYGAVIAKGDEVLDWREMLGLFGNVAGAPPAAGAATVRLLPGSDHAISDFEAQLPFILGFLNLLDDPDQPNMAGRP
jgi:predicted esterase YcpF (UPF0227 family)